MLNWVRDIPHMKNIRHSKYFISWMDNSDKSVDIGLEILKIYDAWDKNISYWICWVPNQHDHKVTEKLN